MVAIAQAEDVIAQAQDLPDPAELGAALTRLLDVRTEINARILARKEETQMLFACLLAGQHMLLLGPPGTAKSMLMEEVASRIILADGSPFRTFRLLMNKFTQPEALLGPISVQGLKNDRYEHVTTGSMAEAHVILLDEIYKASTAIANLLLMAINERQVDIGTGKRIDIPLQTMIAASNELPPDIDALMAFHDRLLVRMQVGYLERDDFIRLLSSAAQSTEHHLFRRNGSWSTQSYKDGTPAPASISADDLLLMQRATCFIEVPPPVIGALEQVRTKLAEQGIIASDRRWMWCVGLLRAVALMAGRNTVEDEDMTSVVHVLWNKLDEIPKIRKEINRASNPASAKVTEKLEAAASAFTQFTKGYASETNTQARYSLCGDAMTNLKAARDEVIAVKKQAEAKNESSIVKKAEDALGRINGWILEVSERLVA